MVHLILKVENVTNDPCSGFCWNGSHLCMLFQWGLFCSLMVLCPQRYSTFSSLNFKKICQSNRIRVRVRVGVWERVSVRLGVGLGSGVG